MVAPEETLKSKQTRSRHQRGADRKRDREVFETAARIFYEKGYRAATVQDVANALGILKGSLYHYISSKEDLLFELLLDAHQEVDRILREVEAVPDLGPLERIELYIHRQVLYGATNLHKVSVYYADLDQLEGTHRDEILARRGEHEAFVRDLIVAAQKRGEVRHDDPTILANCLFALVIWIYRWYKNDGPIEPAELARSCTAFALGGLRTGAHPRPA